MFGWQRPNQYGFTPDPHEHFEKIGHTVSVSTPGEPLHKGVLVSVGSDRLVLSSAQGIVVIHRLITTQVGKAG